MFVVYFVFLFTLLMSHSVWAISQVGGVAIDKNEISIEKRISQEIEEGQSSRFRMRQHIDYGLNDFYAFRFVTLQEKQGLSSFIVNGFGFENRFQLIEKKDYGFNSGFRLNFRKNTNTALADNIQIRLLNEFFPIATWRYRQNFIFERETGSDARDGLGFSFRQQVFHQFHPEKNFKTVGYGVELWNNFNFLDDATGFHEQNHQIGSILELTTQHNLTLRPQYLRGISENSPSHTFGFSITKKF